MTQVWIFLDFCELCKNGCLDFLFASSESFKFWAFPFLWERRVRVYVHILYCSNERCCVGFWYDLGFVWFLNMGFLVDLIKLDWLLDKLALDVQCDGIEFGNDNWILNWNLLWRSWQLCWKFQILFYFFTSGFLLGCYSCIMLIKIDIVFFLISFVVVWTG